MKLIQYYEHNQPTPIVKNGIKLFYHDSFELFDDGTIKVNGKIVNKNVTERVEKEIDDDVFDVNKDGKVDGKDILAVTKRAIKNLKRKNKR